MRDEHIAAIESALAAVLGETDSDARHARRQVTQQLGESAATTLALPSRQLVYGELDVHSVARLLDAADVRDGDRFLDIGSGDGLPTLAAALLYPDAFEVCRGIEVVPSLAARSRLHALRLRKWLADEQPPRGPRLRAAPIELFEGDIHAATSDPTTQHAVGDTSLALCFATTWAHDDGRVLPRLSRILHASLPVEARVVLVDARLRESDGWRWEGDLRIHPPDTAPYSTARLYTRHALPHVTI